MDHRPAGFFRLLPCPFSQQAGACHLDRLMKTVLFATDHTPPDPKALDYALLLCRRMAARLEVLHILPSPASAGGGGQVSISGIGPTEPTAKSFSATPSFKNSGLPEADRILKNTAFDQVKRLLPDHPDTRVDYRCEITGEATGAIIERYVRSHRNIVITVFDPRSQRHSSDIRKKTKHLQRNEAMPRLAVPLVLMKKAQ
jgi:hypothetical protein